MIIAVRIGMGEKHIRHGGDGHGYDERQGDDDTEAAVTLKYAQETVHCLLNTAGAEMVYRLIRSNIDKIGDLARDSVFRSRGSARKAVSCWLIMS